MMEIHLTCDSCGHKGPSVRWVTGWKTACKECNPSKISGICHSCGNEPYEYLAPGDKPLCRQCKLRLGL